MKLLSTCQMATFAAKGCLRFDGLIDELDDCFLTVTRQKKEQLKSKVRKKWGIFR